MCKAVVPDWSCLIASAWVREHREPRYKAEQTVTVELTRCDPDVPLQLRTAAGVPSGTPSQLACSSGMWRHISQMGDVLLIRPSEHW